MNLRVFLCCTLLLVAMPCHAYLGPGMGAGVLAAIIGILVSIFAAILAIVYYPIKRAMKKKKMARNEDPRDSQEKNEAVEAEQSGA